MQSLKAFAAIVVSVDKSVAGDKKIEKGSERDAMGETLLKYICFFSFSSPFVACLPDSIIQMTSNPLDTISLPFHIDFFVPHSTFVLFSRFEIDSCCDAHKRVDIERDVTISVLLDFVAVCVCLDSFILS